MAVSKMSLKKAMSGIDKKFEKGIVLYRKVLATPVEELMDNKALFAQLAGVWPRVARNAAPVAALDAAAGGDRQR